MGYLDSYEDNKWSGDVWMRNRLAGVNLCENVAKKKL